MLVGWYILTYSKRFTAATIHVVVYVLYVAVMLAPSLPMSVHVTLQLFAIPMISSAKVASNNQNDRNLRSCERGREGGREAGLGMYRKMCES